jgi:elongation factor P
MDSESFEEKIVPSNIMDEKEKWITEGMEVNLVYFKDSVIEVTVPSNFIYEIIETEPNAKGNTAQGHTKPATLDSGAVITVPGYLDVGEKVKVDTEKGVYLERANK